MCCFHHLLIFHWILNKRLVYFHMFLHLFSHHSFYFNVIICNTIHFFHGSFFIIFFILLFFFYIWHLIFTWFVNFSHNLFIFTLTSHTIPLLSRVRFSQLIYFHMSTFTGSFDIWFMFLFLTILYSFYTFLFLVFV